MNKKSVAYAIITVFLGLSLVAGQAPLSTYSESEPYSPREWPIGNVKAKKNESKGKDPIEAEVETTESFLLPVSVAGVKGQEVVDVEPSGFTVFLDGVPQKNEVSTASPAGINFILLIDTSPSASLREGQFADFARSAVEGLRLPDKMMIVQFNSETAVKSPLTGDGKLLQKAVAKLEMGGGTSIYDSVNEIFRKLVPKIPERSVVVILTDGIDTTSRKSSFERSLIEVEKTATAVFPIYFDTVEAVNSRSKRTMILPNWGGLTKLGTGGPTKLDKEIGVYYLNDLAKLSGGRAIASKSMDPKKAISSIRDEIANQYVLNVQLPKRRIGQRFSIQVRVNRPNLQVFAKGSYIVTR